MKIATKKAIERRVALLPDQPIKELATILIDADGVIPIGDCAEALDVQFNQLFRWLTKSKAPGRSKTEQQQNNDKIKKLVLVLQSAESLPLDKDDLIQQVQQGDLHESERTDVQ